MTIARTCPSCGVDLPSDAPQGFCPRCLVQLGHDLLPAEARAIVKSPAPDTVAADPAPITNPKSQIGAALLQSFGDYELVEEIARGGMGIVYKARQRSLDRVVALKRLLFGALSSPEFVKRFRAEATVAGSLQHPNIVAIHEVGIHQGEHYLVMDFVAGQTLAKLVAQQPLPSKRAAAYVKTIAEAVHYAHERGILHRDLKPSNVLIDEFDQPRITDFGLAKRFDPVAADVRLTSKSEADLSLLTSAATEITVTGQVLGSPNYMPPEQAASDRGKVSRRSDVYALGAMLYHLTTGRPPFVAQTPTETLQQVLESEPVSPRLLTPGVPRDLETIALKCLEKDPARRYPTAQALADELDRFLHDEPILARPVTRAERAWRWCRRKPVIASLATATVLLLLAVAIGSPIAALRINREKQRAEQIAADRRLDVYVADMKVAHVALQEGNRGLAVERLNKYLPQFGVPASASSASDKASASSDRLKAGLQTDLRGFEWRYLWKLCEGEELFTLRGHSNRVGSVAFDRTGTWLASGSDDETVRIWNLDRPETAQVLPIADPVLTTVAFSPSADALAIGGGRQVRIREGAGWNSERVLTNAYGCLAFSPDGRTLVTDGNGGMMIWDTASWQLVRRLDGLHACHYGEIVSNPDFSPDGTRFALANYVERPQGRGVVVRVWPFATLKAAGLEGSPSVLLNPGTNTIANVRALRFSPDGQLLAAGDWVGLIGLWETASGNLLSSANVAAVITGFVFLTDGRTLVSTTTDQHLSVWDYSSRANLTPAGRRQGHDHEVNAAALSPNGQLLATGSVDATVKIWDVPSLRTARPNLPHADGELPMEHHPIWISHDGRRVAAVNSRLSLDSGFGEASRVSFVDTTTLATVDSISFAIPFQFIALTTNGQRLAIARTNGVVEIWDVADKQRPLSTLKGPVHDSGAAWRQSPFGWKALLNDVWSPDGNRLVTFWPKVKVWDVNTGLGHELPIHSEASAAGFSPDGTTLAVARSEGIELWNSQTGQRITVCKGQMRGNDDLTFSRDGRMLIALSGDIARLWEVSGGRLLGTLAGQTLWFDHAAFSTDGRTIATHLGGSFTLWNVRNGQELLSLKMGKLGEGRVLFSGDGQTLIVHKARRQALVLRAPSLAEIDKTARR